MPTDTTISGTNSSNIVYTSPYTFQYTTPLVENEDDFLSIKKCKKGFIVEINNKEYACESLHSAYEVVKKLFAEKK